MLTVVRLASGFMAGSFCVKAIRSYAAGGDYVPLAGIAVLAVMFGITTLAIEWRR